MKKSGFEAKSDEELMEFYQMGEIHAFDILFERHSGRVLGYLQKKMCGAKEAEDLLQETFFKLHRSRHQYDRALPFSPWLFSITRSVWLDRLKKKRFEDSMEPDKLEALQVCAADGNRGDAGELLESLPANQKEALVLRVFDEATFEEIALRLSTSPENARQLVSRGLKRLREIWALRKGT